MWIKGRSPDITTKATCFHSERFHQRWRRDTVPRWSGRVRKHRAGGGCVGDGIVRVKPYLLFRWAADLVREPAVLDAVEDLIGPDIMVFHTTMWWKTKGSPNRVPWHQDGTYFGLAPYEHVTAWVALSPSNTGTGCVRVVPDRIVWGRCRMRIIVIPP